MTLSGTDSLSGANSSDVTNSTFDPIPAIPIPLQSAIKPTPIPTPEKKQSYNTSTAGHEEAWRQLDDCTEVSC